MHVQRTATMGLFAWLLSRGDARPPTMMSRTYAHDVKGSIKLSRKRVNLRQEPMLTRKRTSLLEHGPRHRPQKAERRGGEGAFYRGLTGVYCHNFRHAQGRRSRAPSRRGQARTSLEQCLQSSLQRIIKRIAIFCAVTDSIELLYAIAFFHLSLGSLVHVYHSCCLSNFFNGL